MILLDTSGVLAAIDASQRDHAACRAVLEQQEEPLLLSPFVLAELDYLLASRIGVAAELSLLEEVTRGAFRLEPFSANDVQRAREVIEKYQDHKIGLADASLVVLAERHEVFDVLTLDRKHFSILRASRGRVFRIRP